MTERDVQRNMDIDEEDEYIVPLLYFWHNFDMSTAAEKVATTRAAQTWILPTSTFTFIPSFELRNQRTKSIKAVPCRCWQLGGERAAGAEPGVTLMGREEFLVPSCSSFFSSCSRSFSRDQRGVPRDRD